MCLINYALCNENIWGSGGIAPPFLTSALDAGELSVSRPCRFTPPPSPETIPRYPQEAGWAPEQVWMLYRRKNLTPTGIRSPAVQTVARRYTECGIPTPGFYMYHLVYYSKLRYVSYGSESSSGPINFPPAPLALSYTNHSSE
jgi:hypothetical protein